MASAEFTIRASEIPEMRALIEACVDLILARNAGADVYEALDEVAAIQAALAAAGIIISDSTMNRADLT